MASVKAQTHQALNMQRRKEMRVEGGREAQEEGLYVYLQLMHTVVSRN